MQGKRLRFSKLVRTGFLVGFTAISLGFSSHASEVADLLPDLLPKVARQTWSRTMTAQDVPQAAPSTRAEALLSPSTIPVKYLWLAAGLGLIYCLRRPKKA